MASCVFLSHIESHLLPGWSDRGVLQELAASWEAIVAALATADKPAVAEAALGYVYVWYNFMPLSRGSAVVGYITLLGIFLAAGMPISAPIPEARAWAAACLRARPVRCIGKEPGVVEVSRRKALVSKQKVLEVSVAA